MALTKLKTDINKIVRVGDRVDKIFKNLSKSKKLKNKKSKNLTHIRAMKKSIFLNHSTKKAFNY